MTVAASESKQQESDSLDPQALADISRTVQVEITQQVRFHTMVFHHFYVTCLNNLLKKRISNLTIAVTVVHIQPWQHEI